MGTPTSAVVHWRTDTVTDGWVCGGNVPGNITNFKNNSAVATEHGSGVVGLSADTLLFSVGLTAVVLEKTELSAHITGKKKGACRGPSR